MILVAASAGAGLRGLKLDTSVTSSRDRTQLGAPSFPDVATLADNAFVVVEQLVNVSREWVRKQPKARAGRRRVSIPSSLSEVLADGSEDTEDTRRTQKRGKNGSVAVSTGQPENPR